MNQERPIEKLLRRAAKDRLEQSGGPWSVHPATRRLLQSEVARQYPGKNESPERGWHWATLFPRLAWALGVFAVLALGLWAFLPERSAGPTQLAMDSEPVRERYLAQPPAERSSDPALGSVARFGEIMEPSFGAASAPGTPGQVMAPLSSASVSESEAAVAEARTAKRTKPQTPDTATAVEEKLRAAWDDNSTLARVAPAPAAKPASAPANGASLLDSEAGALRKDSPQVFYGYFAASEEAAGAFARRRTLEPNQAAGRDAVAGVPVETRGLSAGAGTAAVASAPARAPAADRSQVLENFQLNRVGDEITVVDNDGSLYRGRVEPGPAAESQWHAEDRSQLFSGGGNVILEDSRRQLGAVRLDEKKQEISPPASPLVSQEQVQRGEQLVLNFAVVGTNKTLGRKVEFTGKLFSNAAQIEAQQSRQSQAGSLLFENQVMGRVVVEGSPPVEVNAVPVQQVDPAKMQQDTPGP